MSPFEDLWSLRTKAAVAIGAPLATAGAAIAVGVGVGDVARGCIDRSSVTNQETAVLGPNFDYEGGTAVIYRRAVTWNSSYRVIG